MAQILRPLLSHTGHISADERTNNLLVIDTAENLMRIEKIITKFDVPEADETVIEIFEIHYVDPAEIVKSLRMLISGQPGFGAIIEPGKQPIVLIPEPRRKWIIAKASAENIKQIGQWIEKLDTRKTIGMDPVDAAVYEQLETIVDLSDLTPGISFGEVIERLKNSVDPPLQIQPIWRDLLENVEVERATLSGMEPLTRVKLRKALEILLAGVSSTELAKLTYIVDGGVILIGTADMLPPKMLHRVYDISDLIESAADADDIIRRITEKIEPDSWYGFSDKGEGTITAYPLRQPKNFAVMQSYDIHQQIEHFLNGMRSSRRKREKATPAIKPQEMLKIRQDYIDSDPVVKALSEKVANAEVELIVARQNLPPSHPQVRQKAELLQLLKKRLDERITAAGKSFDDMMKKETYKNYKAKQEEIAKLLDELPEPNLPLAPEVPLITNTFIDSDLVTVLQDIASMADIPIIPDEKVVGLVTAELKDVPLETALDIVLAGTPYVVKKTPYYYLVASAVEPLEIQKRVDSAKKLSNLGKALLIHANDHEDKYPDSLHTFAEYLKLEDFHWAMTNVEYLARGKTIAVRPDTVIAYDKKLLAERKGTNVLFNDSHVEFVKPERLKELGISATEIQIETRILFVSEDFLKDIGLDANSMSSSDAWSEHLVADSAAEPNSETYSLILDDLHISFLLKAVQAHKGATVLVAPRVMTREGTTASMAISTESYYISGYNEPNRPSDKPVPKVDKVEQGTRIWLKPELTPDGENVRLDFKLEIRQLLGYEERKYKGKYIYMVPRTEVVSTKMPCLIPDGKTLLIVGQKITEQVSAAPILNKLPVIGELFRSRDKTKEQRILLILVRPTINPQQKASKILPGQEDAEEHIKHLGRLLEKKLNPPAEPK